MSGRWGDRPLRRGDGGYSNPKSVWHLPSNCAREQPDGTQEQKWSYSRKSKQLPTTWPVCSLPNPPSIARRIHSLQYFPPLRREVLERMNPASYRRGIRQRTNWPSSRELFGFSGVRPLLLLCAVRLL